jgi:hypothetical protein
MDSRATKKKQDWDARGDTIIDTQYYGDSHPAVVYERSNGICEHWDTYTRCVHHYRSQIQSISNLMNFRSEASSRTQDNSYSKITN